MERLQLEAFADIAVVGGVAALAVEGMPEYYPPVAPLAARIFVGLELRLVAACPAVLQSTVEKIAMARNYSYSMVF